MIAAFWIQNAAIGPQISAFCIQNVTTWQLGAR